MMMEKHLFPTALEEILTTQSGLLGISSISSEMEQIEKNLQEGGPAELAFSMFIYRLRQQIGAMVAALEGLDLLVFSGGIGEHSVRVRQSCCQHLHYLGVHLDAEKNALVQSSMQIISAQNSQVKVYVVPTNEELEMVLQLKELH